MHMESHPTCAECGKRFTALVNLKKHQEEHEKFQCTICGNEVLSREKSDHIQMHIRQDLFKRTLDNGKTLKKPKAKGDVKTTTGYNVFVKTNHSKTKEQNPGLTGDQIRKLVAAEWKSLGVVGQQVYKDMARNGEVEVQEVQVTERWVQENQTTRQESQGRRNQENRGRQENQARRNQENQLNRMTPGQDQGRIHPCNLCGALYSGKVELENHMLMSHSTAGPSPQSQAAVAASILAVVNAADVEEAANTEVEELVAIEEVTNAENITTLEELATVDEVGVEKEVVTEKEVGTVMEMVAEKEMANENVDKDEQVKGIFISKIFNISFTVGDGDDENDKVASSGGEEGGGGRHKPLRPCSEEGDCEHLHKGGEGGHGEGHHFLQSRQVICQEAQGLEECHDDGRDVQEELLNHNVI